MYGGEERRCERDPRRDEPAEQRVEREDEARVQRQPDGEIRRMVCAEEPLLEGDPSQTERPVQAVARRERTPVRLGPEAREIAR